MDLSGKCAGNVYAIAEVLKLRLHLTLSLVTLSLADVSRWKESRLVLLSME
jgi:hypothetical protein